MQDTRFWKIIAVVVCLGLFYVGHGLHSRGGDPIPSLTNAAHAGGAVVVNGNWVYTTNQDGQTLHAWVIEPDSGKAHYTPSRSATALEDNRPAQKR